MLFFILACCIKVFCRFETLTVLAVSLLAMVILAMDPVRDWMTKSDETLALQQSWIFDAFGFIVLCLWNRWKVLGGTLIGCITWIVAHNSFSIVMWLMTAWMVWVVFLAWLPWLASMALRWCGDLFLSCWFMTPQFTMTSGKEEWILGTIILRFWWKMGFTFNYHS